MDDASAKLEARDEPIYHPVWGKDADELTLAPFTQNSGHPPIWYTSTSGKGFSAAVSHTMDGGRHQARPLIQTCFVLAKKSLQLALDCNGLECLNTPKPNNCVWGICR
jgi:hypothetical protein